MIKNVLMPVTATPSELLFADGFEILPRTFP